MLKFSQNPSSQHSADMQVTSFDPVQQGSAAPSQVRSVRKRSKLALGSLNLGLGLFMGGLLALAQSAQAAEVYKWVDDSGVTHYSARPPENVTDFEELHVQGQVSQRSRPSATTQALVDDSADDDEEGSDEENLTRPGAEISVKNPDKVAANCARARANIETIQSRRRVSLNDANGGQRRLTDEERLALLAESQSYLDRWCDDN